MSAKLEHFQDLEHQLLEAAKKQNVYEMSTINLIAPASPTLPKYTRIEGSLERSNSITEGLLDNRPYAGAEFFNNIESIAVQAACDLFGAEHANVQPHSVSQANQAVYQALLENGAKVLAMEFSAGGHLTHGMSKNFSGRFFDFDFYGVDEKGYINYEEIEKKAKLLKPRLIVCGASSYPRIIEFDKLSKIAKEVGAYLLADLSHPAGFVATDNFPRPFPHCDVVTLTPDKTMLGPHGGIILCKKELKSKIDKAVHPGTQSSIPLGKIFSTALCLTESGKPWFEDYIDRVIGNMKVLERKFNEYPGLIVTGGSDTNVMVLNTYNVFNLTGAQAEEILEKIGMLTNRQVVPGEKLKPYVASGLRLGTSWITGRGYSEEETELIANIIIENFKNPSDQKLQQQSKLEVTKLIEKSRSKDVWGEEMKYE